MSKKLITALLSLTILLFSGICTYAVQEAHGAFFYRELVVNGVRVSNYNLQSPLFIYNNTTYLPVSQEFSALTGVEATADWNTRTLTLVKKEATATQAGQAYEVNSGSSLKPIVVPDMKVEVKAHSGAEEVLNMGTLPVLSANGAIYLPLQVFKESKVLAWDYHYDSNFGLAISTKAQVKAASYYNEVEARYNRGLVTYMKTHNKALNEQDAQKMVFAFKRASRNYGINELMLIAIAKRESNFHPEVVSSGGAVGLMQIMPKTAANFGVTTWQLKEPEISINIAASMLANGLKSYNGDTIKSLSAYAYGSGRVNRGNYSTVHATNVLKLQGGINQYLSNNGYK